MVKMKYIEFSGAEHEVEVKPGTSLMEAARMNNVAGYPGRLRGCLRLCYLPCHG